MSVPPDRFIAWFETLGKSDVARVGGKNASLGEIVQRLAPAACACRKGLPPLRRRTARMSRRTASAARRRAITPSSPASWWSRASTPSPSIRTASSLPRATLRRAEKRLAAAAAKAA